MSIMPENEPGKRV